MIGTYLLRLRTLLLSVALVPLVAGAAIADEALTSEERSQIEDVVREYLLENPEIILEAIQVLEQRERMAQENQRSGAIAALVPTLTASPLTPVIGEADGDVTLIEFFDYQCGYCKRFYPALQEIMEEDDSLRVILVEFPILGPASLTASRAALAAQQQNGYMDFHDALMAFEGRLSEEGIFETARAVGLDEDQLRADMEDPRIMEYLSFTRDVASSLDVTGTPSMVVGDQFVGGFIPAEDLRALIASMREQG